MGRSIGNTTRAPPGHGIVSTTAPLPFTPTTPPTLKPADVVNVEQAKIAEEAGAVAVMALERIPADIRRDGGVARMSDPAMIKEIKAAVTIPVMAKVCACGSEGIVGVGFVGDGRRKEGMWARTIMYDHFSR